MKKKDNIIVFDIETRNTFRDVGSRAHEGLRLSIMVAYLYKEDSYKVFDEKNIKEFIDLLKKADLIVGFNIKGFDIPVLQKYSNESLQNLPLLDIMYEVMYSCGKRYKLDYLAEGTLGTKKTADGLMAVEFFRDGRIDELIEYCRQDVKLTKDIYEYGNKHGYLICKKYGTLEKIAVYWQKRQAIKKKLQEAFISKKKAEIVYRSYKQSRSIKRTIDVYSIEAEKVIAFCNYKKSLRTFNINNIESIEICDNIYKVKEKPFLKE
jgi:DEAD/DEAH box helicase domain-containing protein